MRKSMLFTLAALAFMGSLLLGTSYALAGCPYVQATYNLSQNFGGQTLTLNQSGATISGTVYDGTGTPTSISGSLSCPDFGPATISFTRFGSGFTQQFTGTIVPSCPRPGVACTAALLYGRFSHNGSGAYGWYAAR